MSLPVSIVIPTHNRKETLLFSLKALEAQTYPAESIEVIVVADGCTDDTVQSLRSVKTGFALKLIEQDGQGAAVARNEGAKVATGDILIFLDDDIEASNGLVEAHVKEHLQERNRVVIGYLPPVIYCKKGFFHSILREWWEAMFEKMRYNSYRYNFRNLTSGNFSISRSLFFEVNGFNRAFKCQEDYELGIRLIWHKAQFKFSAEAMGYHHEKTDLNRSLRRKQQEGAAAILFAQHYPELLPTLDVTRIFRSKNGFRDRALLSCYYHLPWMAALYTKYLKLCLHLMEKMRRRHAWNSYLDRLLACWYIKGVADATGSRLELKKILSSSPKEMNETLLEIKVDVKSDLKSAEKTVDEIRPTSAQLYFGSRFIGTLHHKCGYERLRGIHIRAALAREFQWELIEAIAFEKLTGEKLHSKTKDHLFKSKEITYGYNGA